MIESSVLNPIAELLVVVSMIPALILFTLKTTGDRSVVPMKLVEGFIPPLPVKLQPLANTIVCQLGVAEDPIFTINWFFTES